MQRVSEQAVGAAAHQERPARAADRQDRPRRARRADGAGRPVDPVREDRADGHHALRPARVGQDDDLRQARPAARRAAAASRCSSRPTSSGPAAVEQLKVIGQQLGVPVYSEAGVRPGQGLPGRPGRGQPPGPRHDHPRHRRPAPRRRRADGRAEADREEGQAAPGLLRLRRPDRPGRRRLGRRLQQGAGARRRDHDQARRRRPRRRGAVGQEGDGRPDQVRRQGGEARQARTVRPRAAGRPDARHGRHRRPGRGGAVGRRPGGGRSASRRSWPRGSSTSTTSASRSSR